MLEQEPTTSSAESSRDLDSAAPTEQSQSYRIRESSFTNQVIDEAHHYGWQSFHLRDRDSIHIVRGRGFPDLVIYRRDSETGQTELIAAELKRGYDSELRDEQKDWLEALGQHIPTYEWRPEDWDEIETILRDGPKPSQLTIQIHETRGSLGQIPANFGNIITGLAETIEAMEYGTGPRAQLRRMDFTNPDSAAFWQLMIREGMPRNPDVAKWGLITHGIALMAHGAGVAHKPRISVGQALHQGDKNPFYSEPRLATLLAARGTTLHRLLAGLFRMLANKSISFNWREMAWFILNEGYNDERAEEARVEIARAYYREHYQAQRRATQDSGE